MRHIIDNRVVPRPLVCLDAKIPGSLSSGLLRCIYLLLVMIRRLMSIMILRLDRKVKRSSISLGVSCSVWSVLKLLDGDVVGEAGVR